MQSPTKLRDEGINTSDGTTILKPSWSTKFVCTIFLPQQTAKRVWCVCEKISAIDGFWNWWLHLIIWALQLSESVPSLTQCPPMAIEVSYWIFPQLPFSEYLLCPISLVPIYSCSVLLCVSHHLQQLKKVSSNFFLSWLKDKKTSGDNKDYNTPPGSHPQHHLKMSFWQENYAFIKANRHFLCTFHQIPVSIFSVRRLLLHTLWCLGMTCHMFPKPELTFKPKRLRKFWHFFLIFLTVFNLIVSFKKLPPTSQKVF